MPVTEDAALTLKSAAGVLSCLTTNSRNIVMEKYIKTVMILLQNVPVKY